MRILRQLIREVVHDSSEKNQKEIIKNLDKLAHVLLEMFSRLGEWMFSPDDPEVEEVRNHFGIPFEYIADGSFRVTFSIGNNRIIKISKDLLGAGAEDDFDVSQMNQDDWTMGKDDLVTDIFPRSYEHAPDFSWIVMEQVEPLRQEEDFFKYFRTKLLPDPVSLGEEGRSDYETLIRILLEMNHYKLMRPLREEDNLKGYFLGSEIVKKSENPEVSLLDIRRDLIKNSRTFRGFVRALTRYNIRVSEINGDNVGIAKDGRLVLLDSSIFPSD